MTVDGTEMALMAGTTTVYALTYIELLLLQLNYGAVSKNSTSIIYKAYNLSSTCCGLGILYPS